MELGLGLDVGGVRARVWSWGLLCGIGVVELGWMWRLGWNLA